MYKPIFKIILFTITVLHVALKSAVASEPHATKKNKGFQLRNEYNGKIDVDIYIPGNSEHSYLIHKVLGKSQEDADRIRILQRLFRGCTPGHIVSHFISRNYTVAELNDCIENEYLKGRKFKDPAQRFIIIKGTRHGWGAKIRTSKCYIPLQDFMADTPLLSVSFTKQKSFGGKLSYAKCTCPQITLNKTCFETKKCAVAHIKGKKISGCAPA